MVENVHIEQIRSLNLGKLPKYDLEYLEKTCEEFPCFHSAFLMKAVYKKQEDEAAFQEELPSFAVRVLNRSVLYDRVHASYSQDLSLPKEKAADEELIAVVDEAAQLTEAPQESIVEDLKGLVDAIQKKQEINPIVSKVAKTPKKKAKIAKKKKAPKLEKKEKQVVINSFTDWLKHKNAVGAQEEVKVTPVPQPEANEERIPIDMVASNEAELMLEAKRSSFKLEDFLVNQIERKQHQKEQSGSQNLFGISETYAKILTDQGKIQEAIKVYKELSIKYPKKSSNFASQIENLKNNL